VALEFTGPLGVAVAGSRRILDAIWVVLAAAGVILLTPWGGLHLDALGVLLALLAGLFWASYIVLSAKVGRVFPGSQGLTIALLVGALALVPAGAVGGGSALLLPRTLLLGAAVGILSSVVPYTLELEALRTLPTRVFGVLMSTEPAVGALVGFVFLQQVLGLRSIAAIALVCTAAVGASLFGRPDVPAREAGA
jgi:inner membrane transporter RhtA